MVAVLLLAYGGAVLLVATRGFDDWVPLVAPVELDPAIDRSTLPRAAHFECPGAFEATGPGVETAQASRALEIQDLTREPCVDAHSQRRMLDIGSMAIVTVGLLGCGALATRRRRARPGPRGASTARPGDGTIG